MTCNVLNRKFHLTEFSQSSIQYDDVSLKYSNLNVHAMKLYSFLLADDWDTGLFCISVEVFESASDSLWNPLSYFTGASHKPDSRPGAHFEWSVIAVAAGWVGKGEAEFVWLPTQREISMFAYDILHDTRCL
jgi:hypothetical protein